MTLRAKLALLFGLVGLVASALVGIFAFRATEGELAGSTDRFLVDRADEIASGLRRAPERQPGRSDGDQTNDQPSDVQGGQDTRLPFDADAAAQTISASGEILDSGTRLPVTQNTMRMADLEPRRLSRENVRFDDVEIDGEAYRMVSLALPDGGALQVARAVEETRSVQSDLVVRIAVIAAIVAVFGALLGAVIARRATRHLRQLADVAGNVASTHDFTTRVDVGGNDEIGQLAASFREMLRALEQSREQQHRLVHDAGHELRTPLTSLRANVAMLERFEQMDAEDRGAVVAALRSELIELGDLFTELIDLATDQHDDAVELVPLDLDRLVQDVVARWERRADRSISSDTPERPVRVLGDEAMIDRALTNLLSNADKFSPAGAPIDVSITVVDGARVGDAATARVAVVDRGPGIPPEERGRIFDRFYRSELTRSMPGSGLGLAIVSQIVDRHGGAVFVDDPPAGGAEIGFTLPVAPDA